MQSNYHLFRQRLHFMVNKSLTISFAITTTVCFGTCSCFRVINFFNVQSLREPLQQKWRKIAQNHTVNRIAPAPSRKASVEPIPFPSMKDVGDCRVTNVETLKIPLTHQHDESPYFFYFLLFRCARYTDLPPLTHRCIASIRISEIHIALAPVRKAAAFIVAIGSSGSGQLML